MQTTPLTPKDFVDTNKYVRCAVIFLFAAAMASQQKHEV